MAGRPVDAVTSDGPGPADYGSPEGVRGRVKGGTFGTAYPFCGCSTLKPLPSNWDSSFSVSGQDAHGTAVNAVRARRPHSSGGTRADAVASMHSIPGPWGRLHRAQSARGDDRQFAPSAPPRPASSGASVSLGEARRAQPPHMRPAVHHASLQPAPDQQLSLQDAPRFRQARLREARASSPVARPASLQNISPRQLQHAAPHSQRSVSRPRTSSRPRVVRALSPATAQAYNTSPARSGKGTFEGRPSGVAVPAGNSTPKQPRAVSFQAVDPRPSTSTSRAPSIGRDPSSNGRSISGASAGSPSRGSTPRSQMWGVMGAAKHDGARIALRPAPPSASSPIGVRPAVSASRNMHAAKQMVSAPFATGSTVSQGRWA